MSSILDALNKLEEDKARTAEGPDIDLEAATADLVGRNVMSERVTLRLRPVMFIAVGGVAAVTLVAASVGVSLLVLGKQTPQPASTPPPTTVVAAIAQVEPAPPVQTAPIQEPVTTPLTEEAPVPAEQITRELVAEVDPKIRVAAEHAIPTVPVVQPTIYLPTEQVDTPHAGQVEERLATPPVRPITPQAPTPKSPVQQPRVEATPVAAKTVPPVVTRPAVSTPRPQEPAASKSVEVARASKPLRPSVAQPSRARTVTPMKETGVAQASAITRVIVSIRELPLLTAAVEARHALPQLKLNMVRPIGPSRPHGMAVINRDKVYAGDRIQNSRARLLRVESYGIAVEIVGTNDKYFIPF